MLTFAQAWAERAAPLAVSHNPLYLSRPDDSDPEKVYLSGATMGYEGAPDPRLLRLELYCGEQRVPYGSEAGVGGLTLISDKGRAEISLECGNGLRCRGTGVTLSFSGTMGKAETACSRLDGTCRVCFNGLGELLYVPLEGSVEIRTRWDWGDASSGPVSVQTQPGPLGSWEMAVQYHPWGDVPASSFIPFDEYSKQAPADFRAFRMAYPAIAGEAEAYTLWINQARFPEAGGAACVTRSRTGKWAHAYAAQQCFQALACNDARQGLGYIMSFFNCQDAGGKVPSRMDKESLVWSTVEPPLQGLALCRLLESPGGEMLTGQELEAAYSPLCRWTGWWYSRRCAGALPWYEHPMECGWPWAADFVRGERAQRPDLTTYLILCDRAAAIIARRLDRREEADRWEARARAALDGLAGQIEAWDGKDLPGYMPLLLGDMLEAGSRCRLADSLENILARSGQSPAEGEVPLQALLALSLKAAGRPEPAAKAAASVLARDRQHSRMPCDSWQAAGRIILAVCAGDVPLE